MAAERPAAWGEGAVERLVAPMSLPEFLSRHWERDWARFAGPRDRFTSLFGWDELGPLLADQNFPLANLKLVAGNRRVDPSRYASGAGEGALLRPGSVMQLLGAGATLVLDRVHDVAPAVGALARECERIFEARTTVNLYASWGTQRGFERHWDAQETMILQVAGRKSWQVDEPTRAHPLREDFAKPPAPTGAPTWAGMLEQGDVLYLPRGWWHVAEAVAEPTLHLTVTIVPPTGADLLAWVGERLRRHEAFRMNVPLSQGGESRRAYVEGIRRILAEELDDGSVDRFVLDHRSALPVRASYDFPGGPMRAMSPLGRDSRVRLAADRCLSWRVAGPAQVAFEANGAWWQCASELVPALGRLRHDEAVPVGSLLELLPPGVDGESLVKLLAALALAGAILLD